MCVLTFFFLSAWVFLTAFTISSLALIWAGWVCELCTKCWAYRFVSRVLPGKQITLRCSPYNDEMLHGVSPPITARRVGLLFLALQEPLEASRTKYMVGYHTLRNFQNLLVKKGLEFISGNTPNHPDYDVSEQWERKNNSYHLAYWVT